VPGEEVSAWEKGGHAEVLEKEGHSALENIELSWVLTVVKERKKW